MSGPDDGSIIETPSPDSVRSDRARYPNPIPREGATVAAPRTLGTYFETPNPRRVSAGSMLGDIATDVGKSAAVEAAQKIVSDYPGMPGTIGELASRGSKWAAEGALNLADKVIGLPGGHTPETVLPAIDKRIRSATAPVREAIASAGDWVGRQVAPVGDLLKRNKGDTTEQVNRLGTRIDKAGLTEDPANPSSEWPTSGELRAHAREKIPALKYDPQTRLGRAAGDITSMIVDPLGPGKGVGQRVVLGTMAGIGSHVAGESTHGSDYEPIARILGAVLPPMLLRAPSGNVANALSPKGLAADKLAEAIRRDSIEHGTKMTLDDMREALAAGSPVHVFDAAGPHTRNLIMSAAGPGNEALLGQLNNAISSRNKIMAGANKDRVTNQFSLTDRGGAQAQALATETKVMNDAVYDAARANPRAHAVWSPELGELLKLPQFKTAMAEVDKIAADPKSGVRGLFDPPPSSVLPNVPTGGPVSPAGPPNLSYWDLIKRNLDAQKSAAAADSGAAGHIENLKTRLAAELDAVVPEYAHARATASAGFGAQDAFEAGVKFAAQPNTFKTADILRNYSKFTPEQQTLFQQGVGHSLADMAEKSPQAYVNGLRKPETAERLRGVLGQDGYDRLLNDAVGTSTMANVEMFRSAASQNPEIWNKLKTLAPAAAVGADLMFLHQLPEILQGPAILMASVQAVSGSLKYAAEQRAVPHILEMLSSKDPKVIDKLLTKAAENPAVRSVVEKAGAKMFDVAATSARANPQTMPSQEPLPPIEVQNVRGQRASGGRVGLNHAAEAASLIRMVDKARRTHGMSTEKFLKVPDASVAKALSIANEAI